MKAILLLLMLTVFSLSLKAQRYTDTTDLRNNLGKTVTFCNYITNVKIVADTLTYLHMAGEKFNVVIKGTRIQLDWGNLKGKHACVTGVLVLDKNRLQIVALEPKQVVVDY